MFKRPLSEVCSDIFTGIPPRNRVDEAADTRTVAVVGIRALTHDGTIDISAMERMEVADGARAPSALAKDDVLLSIRGNAPKCAIVQTDFPEPTYASGNLAVIRPDITKIDAAYLWAVIMQISRDAHHPLLTRATTQQLSIRVGSLHKLAIWLPDIRQQKRIAEVALALRDAVTAEREALELGARTFDAFLKQELAHHE
jgi:hypothetical protein